MQTIHFGCLIFVCACLIFADILRAESARFMGGWDSKARGERIFMTDGAATSRIALQQKPLVVRRHGRMAR